MYVENSEIPKLLHGDPTAREVQRISNFSKTGCFRCAEVRCLGGGSRAGLWYDSAEPGEPITKTREDLRARLKAAMDEGNPSSDDGVEEYISELEALFTLAWPGRPFFIETFQDTGRHEALLMAVYRTVG